MADTRRCEVLGVVARLSDLGMGQPPGRSLRAALVATRLAARLGLDAEERAVVYWVALLQHAGCTAELRTPAEVFGDEIAARGWTATVDTGRPAEVLKALVRHVAVGAPALSRLAAFARTLALMPRLFEAARATCEVAAQIARAVGAPAAAVEALGAVYERWDGKGVPDRRRGEAIPRAVRVVQVAGALELFESLGGPTLAAAELRARRGSALGPAEVDAALAHLEELAAPPAGGSTWEAVMAQEPAGTPPLDAVAIDAALAALGDMADLVSPCFSGHSRAVAGRVGAALQALGEPPPVVRAGRRAAWVHDLGRVGVTVRLWDKPGPLDDDEWERVRLHPYQAGRLLDRVGDLEDVAAMAAMAHERADGSGYPARPGRRELAADVLAAADVYQALIEPRAHRAALPPEAAARVVEAEVAAGRLDARAARAVLDAAGAGGANRTTPWPDGLTEREAEVLCLVAHGLTNKEVAAALGLAPKTVGNHLQNLFPKIGVTTRAAATYYAMQRDLLRWFPAPARPAVRPAAP